MALRALTINVNPEHSASAVPWFVSENDDVWDREKIEKEIQAFGWKESEHPYDEYQTGKTRYDLDAPFTLPDGRVVTIRDYWLDGVEPARFKIRRLNPDENATAKDLQSRGLRNQAYVFASHRGLTGIEGVEGLKFKKRNNVLDDAIASTLDAAGLLTEIGSAVMLLSLPLGDREKK